MVRPCSENGRRKITQNSIEVDAETKESTSKTEKKNWMEGIRKAMNERNLNEGQWEDRKQWSLGVGQRRKTFWNRYDDNNVRNKSQQDRSQQWVQQSVISNLKNFGVRTHFIGNKNWLTLVHILQLLKSISGFPEPTTLKPEVRWFHIKKIDFISGKYSSASLFQSNWITLFREIMAV